MQLRERARVAARNFVYDRLVFGSANRFVRPVYDRVIDLEVRAAAFADGAKRFERIEHVTAVIKTFERPLVVRRLVASIKRLYPTLPIVVVDDSRSPTELEGVEFVTMPYDSGVSAGRNEGLRRVTTPFVMVLDDDFVFTRRTRILAALAALREPSIDLVGGRVVFLPLYLDQSKPDFRGEQRIGRWRVCEKVPNFYVARTERVRLVGWDDRLKRVDHMDFFLRADGVLTSVYEPLLECLHARTLMDSSYMEKRLDTAADVDLLRKKFSL